MPAESEKQRRYMCLLLSIKLGKAKGSPEAMKAAKSMSLKDLSEFCRSKVKK